MDQSILPDILLVSFIPRWCMKLTSEFRIVGRDLG
jgi:hypothetical protein